MHALTDNALMLKVKSGELDKLGLLYERHKNRLFGFFYHLNGNAAVSEDLVQNVFIRILKYRNTFTGEGQFTAWMFRMARNVNNDHYRKNQKIIHMSSDRASMSTPEDMEDLNTVMDQEDDISQLSRALQRLPLDKREILILSKYKEIKFSEIGKMLGCSEGAAKVKAHRALKDLRKIFLQLESN